MVLAVLLSTHINGGFTDQRVKWPIDTTRLQAFVLFVDGMSWQGSIQESVKPSCGYTDLMSTYQHGEFVQFYLRNANFPLAKTNPFVKEFTHCGLVTPYGDKDLGQHWLR